MLRRREHKSLPSILRDGIGYAIVAGNGALDSSDDNLVVKIAHHATIFSHRQSRRRHDTKGKSDHVNRRVQGKKIQLCHNEKELRQSSLLEWGCISVQTLALPSIPLEQGSTTTMKVTLHEEIHWLSIVDKIIQAYQSLALLQPDLCPSEKEIKTIKRVLRELLSSLEETGASLEWDLSHFDHSSTVRACVVGYPLYVAEYHQRLSQHLRLPEKAHLASITVHKMKSLGPQMVIAAKNVLSGSTTSELHRELNLVGEKIIRARQHPALYAPMTERGTELNHRHINKSLQSAVVNVPDILEKTPVLQPPKDYRWLPESAKRRFRRARQRAKRKETSVSAPSNPKPLAAKPKKLSRWQRRELKKGTSPFTTCHHVYHIFSCNHSYPILCSWCDDAWEKEFSLQCPLSAWHRMGIYTMEDSLTFFPHPCRVCPWYDNPSPSRGGSGAELKNDGNVLVSNVPDEVQRWWRRKNLSKKEKRRSNYWKRRKLREVGHEEDSTVEVGWRKMRRG